MIELSELCEVITKGTTPTTLGYEFQKEGISFLKIECFDEDGNFIPDKMVYISEECKEDIYIPYIKLILTSNIVKEQYEKQKQGVAQLNLSLKI